MRKLVFAAVPLLLLALLAGMTGPASAGPLDIIPLLNGGAPTPLNPNFNWSYTAAVHELQRVEAGDWFTIYDFFGFTGTHTEPAGWVFTSANVGLTPGDVIPVDNPGLPNLTWMYQGNTILGPMNLGNFTAVSTSGSVVALGSFSSRATKNVPGLPANGTKVSNVGSVPVPGPVIPEPSTMALSGLGLLGLGVLGVRGLKH